MIIPICWKSMTQGEVKWLACVLWLISSTRLHQGIGPIFSGCQESSDKGNRAEKIQGMKGVSRSQVFHVSDLMQIKPRSLLKPLLTSNHISILKNYHSHCILFKFYGTDFSVQPKHNYFWWGVFYFCNSDLSLNLKCCLSYCLKNSLPWSFYFTFSLSHAKWICYLSFQINFLLKYFYRHYYFPSC